MNSIVTVSLHLKTSCSSWTILSFSIFSSFLKKKINLQSFKFRTIKHKNFVQNYELLHLLLEAIKNENIKTYLLSIYSKSVDNFYDLTCK